MKSWFKELRQLRRQSWLLTAATVALATIGVLFVYSAGYVAQEQTSGALYRRQLLWAAAGLVCHQFFAALDYRQLRKPAWWIYGVSVVLLVLVLSIGRRVYGAQRWLDLPGVQIQPSELAKLATILVLARRLSRPGLNLGQARPLAAVLLAVGVPWLLILKEPDLGTAMVLVPVAFAMMYAAGVPLSALGALAAAGILALGLFVGAMFLPEKLGLDQAQQERIMRRIGAGEYQKERLRVFFKPDTDPLGAGWNKRQSEIAVGSGGVWGKGFLNGTQNILRFLPRSVAPTDFIFCVIAEEKGFAGSLVVLLLFAVLIGGALRTALLAHDKLGRLLCVGIGVLLWAHVFVNISMTVGLLPITGLPLPLLSYGGSFMLTVMAALGIVQSVYIRSRPPEETFEQAGLWVTA